MTTITSRSLPLIPLPIPLSQIISHQSVDGGANLMITGDRSSPNEVMSPVDMQNNEDGQSTVDEMSEARSSPLSSIQTDNYHKDDQDDGDDRMSCCSDDSELSVGKEDVERTTTSTTISDVVRFSAVRSDNNSEILDRRSSMDTTTEDTSNDSLRFPSAVAAARLPQLAAVAAAAAVAKDEGGLRFPLVRPSPTRFQEEFLRSSQLYAEELMKQQMSIVAAARGLNMSPKNHEHSALALRRNLEESVKVGFRPHIRLAEEQLQQPSTENFNFRGIHSHLNAISQITQNIQKITSPTLSITTSRESSQSPPTNHHLHPLHPLHHHHQHMMNNNLNDSNLKFSIDNILKADFGRRITEPLKRSKSSHTKKNSKNSSSSSKHSSKASGAASAGGGAPIDLTASTTTTASATTTSAASALAEKQNCSNSNDETSSVTSNSASNNSNGDSSMIWPAWVYCTRYSDRPSSGPRTRRPKKPPGEKITAEEKRPRTAFSGPQLARLKHEFNENRYLTERRRQQLSSELGLNEAQIKIWFQNKRAKIKKSSGQKNPLALQLMAQGLYNHSTVPLTKEEEELQQLQEQAKAGAV